MIKTKNNVSYFLAGYKAATMEYGKYSAKTVEVLDRGSVIYNDRAREYLRNYDKCAEDDKGLEEMYKTPQF